MSCDTKKRIERMLKAAEPILQAGKNKTGVPDIVVGNTKETTVKHIDYAVRSNPISKNLR